MAEFRIRCRVELPDGRVVVAGDMLPLYGPLERFKITIGDDRPGGHSRTWEWAGTGMAIEGPLRLVVDIPEPLKPQSAAEVADVLVRTGQG